MSAPQERTQALENLPPLREVLAAHGLHPKKGLGQNFIFDLNLTRRIARAAGVQGGAVYEVGPGPGGLTRALLAEGAARIIAVERDSRCLPALEEIAAAASGRLAVIAADALTLDEKAVLSGAGVDQPVPVAANLPYNVGTALFVKWLSAEVWPPWWSSLTLMFQREVAERICARPGTPAYGRLAVLAQWRTRARILFEVGRRAFVPPPKVDSAVLRVEPLSAPLFAARLADLERVTAAAFGQRRKMLRQSLKQLTPDAEGLLKHCGIDGTRRPETLSLEEFCALARNAGT